MRLFFQPGLAPKLLPPDLGSTMDQMMRLRSLAGNSVETYVNSSSTTQASP